MIKLGCMLYFESTCISDPSSDMNKNTISYKFIGNQSNAWDAWQWRKYMWLAIHHGAVTLAVSLHKKMTEAGT